MVLKDTTTVVNFSNQLVLSFLFSAFKSAAHFLWSLRNSTNHCTIKKEHSICNAGWLLKIFFDLLDCFWQKAICFILSICKKCLSFLRISHSLHSHLVGLKLTIMSIKMSCWTANCWKKHFALHVFSAVATV